MSSALLVIGGVAVALLVAMVLGRKPGAPASNTHHVPNLLDRNDFVRPEAPWLVAVFTSSTCDTCAGVWERAELLTSDQVATQRIDFQTDKAMHERYNIDGVPTLVVADADGAVKRGFLGPVTAVICGRPWRTSVSLAPCHPDVTPANSTISRADQAAQRHRQSHHRASVVT